MKYNRYLICGVSVHFMRLSYSAIFLSLLILLISCGQTPKEKIKSDQMRADSIKKAEQEMLKVESEASNRLDSIRKVKKHN